MRLTREERRLRWLLYLNGAIAGAFILQYLAEGIFDGEQFRFVVNSVGKDMLFLALCLLGAADVRRRGWFALLVALGYGTLIVTQAVMLIVGGQEDLRIFGTDIDATVFLLSWMASDVVLAAWLVVWWLAAVRARYGLRYLNPIAFTTLVAMAEVLVHGEREVLSPEEVARNVDGYMADLKAQGKQRVQLAFTALTFFPLLSLRPPLPAMSPESRLAYLERKFISDVSGRRTPRFLRPYLRAAIRVASQMSYLGYYGDERTWPSVGYVPFSKRPGGRKPRDDDRPGHRLVSLSAPPRNGRPYDAIVVGSGAGGAIAAYRLAESGRRVLVLERGPHVDPADFSEDEIKQYLLLYNEGALQLATDFGLQVLQGMCVGGGTTINNGVCLQPPAIVLDRWAERGIDRAGLEQGIACVREWLPVVQVQAKVASGGAKAFAAGVEKLRLPGRLELVHANISDCLGCGYCNMGCPFGKKQSMLDTVLPWGQEKFEGKLDVLPNFRATRIVHERGRAIAVAGEHGGGEVTLAAGEMVVVSAGAVGSSWLLQRSGIGGEGVGRELYFNVNSPLTAEFDDPVDTFAGLQMSHAYLPEDTTSGFVLETWFNPVATQALAMPGWFGQHFENMHRYRHMASGGTLVGTTKPASVRATKVGPQIDYEPGREDIARLISGLKLLAKVFLAGGARRVMPATHDWQAYGSPEALSGLDAYAGEARPDLLLTTAHPQGGNPVGEPGEGGVVDAEFRVHGFANLHVCDASVFPSSVTVNPQLTVMGMAQYAAGRITR